MHVVYPNLVKADVVLLEVEVHSNSKIMIQTCLRYHLLAKWIYLIPATDTWQLEIDGFVNAVLEKSPMLVSLESARRIVTIAEGAITSQTEGRRIILE